MKYKILKAILVSAAIMVVLSGAALAKEVRGTVYGSGSDGKQETLPNASIRWIGTSLGTFADKTGKFTITATDKSNKLEISYTGYEKDTIEVTDFSKVLSVVLKSNLTTEELQVKGNQPARILTNSSINKTEVVTMRGLQKAACCNLSESFQTNPSVDVSFTNAVTGAKQIQLLGLQGVYIQILNEQAPAMRGLSSNLGIEYIPGPWMESIQISKGLASVTSGYESISGQINIEYKKPDISEPLFLNVYANNFGRYEANLTSAHKLSDKLSTMIFGHASFNTEKYDLNKDGFLDKPLSKQFNIMNRWTYKDDVLISQTYLKALYDERNGGQLNFWPDKDTSFYGMQIKAQKYEILTKNGIIFPGDDYKSLAIVASLTHYKVESFFDKVLYNGEQNSVYAKLMFQSDIFNADNKYITGISYSWDNFIENVQPVGKTNPIYEPKMESIPGAFLEYTFSGLKNITFMGGFRADFPNNFKAFLTPRFHIKYDYGVNSSVRASAGKGYRIANIHAEDIGMFASSRKMFMDEKQKPEEAWNYGLNTTNNFELFGYEFNLNAEFYRTEFINQIIMDMEKSQTEMHIYNLKGKSYSNSFQADLSFEPLPGLAITAAYRVNDVKMTVNGSLVDKPLQSRQKGFLNLQYTTDDDSWNFDLTAEYNGGGRIFHLDTIPAENNPANWTSTFPDFFMLHAQISKRIGNLDIYLGAENLTNFTQKESILSWIDPKGTYFEGAMVWGPIIGRVIYFGARLTIN